jgi:formamidopyrimidine-DNA glycosylase
MPGSFKTEAIVLRSIRYGEADRVLHLYTADRGRIGAVAKGVRRVKSRLGGRLEPLSPDFTAEALREQARGRRQPVKAFLLNQERNAGVGNIYADEALLRARIHPLKPVGTLRRAQIESLRDAVVESLNQGIDAKGASIDDYRHVDGARGSFQDRFLVHLRKGEPCVRCGTPIEKMRAAGRGTYICPKCQRRPRGLGRQPRRSSSPA